MKIYAEKSKNVFGASLSRRQFLRAEMCIRDSCMDRTRDQRPAMHRDDDAAVELGNSSRPRLARRSLSQHRAGTWLAARRAVAGRASWTLCMAGWWSDPDRGCDLDDARKSSGARDHSGMRKRV